MTDTMQTSARLRYVIAGVAVLIVAGAIVLFVKLASGPAPVDYKVTLTGVSNAVWITPEGSGTFDTSSGTATQTVHASKVAVTATIVGADAACQITSPDGQVVDSRQASGSGVLTCST
jgi:hypothetical protein